MTISDMVAAMKAAGIASDQIVATVEQLEQTRLAKARAGNASRQRTFRQRNADNPLRGVTPDEERNADNALHGMSRVTVPPDKERSPTPPKEINPPRFVRDAGAREAFERFWTAWPNKTQKTYAERCFAKVASEVDAILDGVSRYIRDKPPDRPWLNPSTFLNQHRWQDEPGSIQPTGANRNGTGKRGSISDAAPGFIERLDQHFAYLDKDRPEDRRPPGGEAVRLLPPQRR